MSWAISENTSEKFKAEMNDCLHGFNSVSEFDFIRHCELYHACRHILEECCDRMKKNARQEVRNKK